MLSHTDRDMQSQYVQAERAAHYHDICIVEKRLLLLKQWEQSCGTASFSQGTRPFLPESHLLVMI